MSPALRQLAWGTGMAEGGLILIGLAGHFPLNSVFGFLLGLTGIYSFGFGLERLWNA